MCQWQSEFGLKFGAISSAQKKKKMVVKGKNNLPIKGICMKDFGTLVSKEGFNLMAASSICGTFVIVIHCTLNSNTIYSR